MNNELTALWENVRSNKDIRQSLSRIRAMIKEAGALDQLAYELSSIDNTEKLLSCLNNEDAKTRKNAALLMGDVAGEVMLEANKESADRMFMEALYDAYVAEQQLFVKSSYLTAIKNYDYREYLDRLKKRLDELTALEPEDSDKKHVDEQIRVLSDMVVMAEGIKKHQFHGYGIQSDIILTTNRRHADTVAEQIKELPDVDPEKVSTFAAGVMVNSDSVDELLRVRTYNELLYKVKGMVVLPQDPIEAAKKAAQSTILRFLDDRHRNEDKRPYYFRVELKSKMDLAGKSTFVKKFATALEKATDRKLINSTSDYELELRLIETKEDRYNCLVKLYTIPDDRFRYRAESTATSLKPVNAALMVELTKKYMVEDAQVLDPFCGVATLLIERQKVVKGNTSYGIDVNPEAIAKAKINTEAAGQIIHFINKDFFEFTHEYLFDEIITDMPFATCHKTEEEIEEIYAKFFAQAGRYLKTTGKIIMYTHNRELVNEHAASNGFKILEHIVMLEKAGTDLYVLEVNNQ